MGNRPKNPQSVQMFRKTKGVSWFEDMFSLIWVKFAFLQHKDLGRIDEGRVQKKRGAPKNEGISNDVYENKGRKKGLPLPVNMLLKTSNLYSFVRMLLIIKMVSCFRTPLHFVQLRRRAHDATTFQLRSHRGARYTTRLHL